MSRNTSRQSRSAGFTLIELLVAMAVVLVIMSVTLTALSNAYKSNESAKAITGLNNNLRIGTDLLVRDLIQVGQGLPTGRIVEVPNGAGALQIQRPHPQGSACTEWPDDTTQLSAVTPGPGCGQAIGGVATDMVTVLAADSSIDRASLSAIDLVAQTVTFASPPAADAVDISNGGPDDIRVGDLIMLTKGTSSTLLYVTAVDGGQTVTFAGGDPMNLNQYDATMTWTGTFNQLNAVAPAGDPAATQATRMRMITYYLDDTLTPGNPRLIRHMNWGDPNLAINQRGRTVGFAIENLQFTYDLVDGTSATLSNVRMDATDLTVAGACAPSACSPNQVRKVNVFVSARSTRTFSQNNRFFRNTLTTQVSLRSLALVDRYD